MTCDMKITTCVIIFVFLLTGCYLHKTSNQLSKKSMNALKALWVNEHKDSLIVNPPYVTEPTSGGEKLNYVTISTFYATDRNIILKGGRPSYGTERSDVHYGQCAVSMPKTHEIGNLESPIIQGIKRLEDPSKHICILDISSSKKEKFFSGLREQFIRKNQNNAYIFIHGYNVSFSEAAKSTAQVYFDFGLKGIPIFYSWPSQESFLKYSIDRENSDWATIHFKQFLDDFLTQTNADNIYLIAHSMGNRLLVNSLATLLKEKKNQKQRFKEIILIAPDIDADIFSNTAPFLTVENRPITLYISASDKALMSSAIFNGHQRAGDASNKPLIINGIETVDATNVSTDIFGHSYFDKSRSVIEDIFYLINNNIRADRRHLSKINTKYGAYWKFMP